MRFETLMLLSPSLLLLRLSVRGSAGLASLPVPGLSPPLLHLRGVLQILRLLLPRQGMAGLAAGWRPAGYGGRAGRDLQEGHHLRLSVRHVGQFGIGLLRPLPVAAAAAGPGSS